MNQADIVWITFPAGAGRAQAGRRPAVIVQNDEASNQLPTVLVVPLTTQKDALRFPGTILVEPDRENSLRNRSVAFVFQLTAINKQLLESRIGAVSDPVLAPLLSAINEIMEA